MVQSGDLSDAESSLASSSWAPSSPDAPAPSVRDCSFWVTTLISHWAYIQHQAYNPLRHHGGVTGPDNHSNPSNLSDFFGVCFLLPLIRYQFCVSILVVTM